MNKPHEKRATDEGATPDEMLIANDYQKILREHKAPFRIGLNDKPGQRLSISNQLKQIKLEVYKCMNSTKMSKLKLEIHKPL